MIIPVLFETNFSNFLTDMLREAIIYDIDHGVGLLSEIFEQDLVDLVNYSDDNDSCYSE